MEPMPEALSLVPPTMARIYRIVPLRYKDGILTVAIGDPDNLSALGDLRNLLGIREVVARLATGQEILDLFKQLGAPV